MSIGSVPLHKSQNKEVWECLGRKIKENIHSSDSDLVTQINLILLYYTSFPTLLEDCGFHFKEINNHYGLIPSRSTKKNTFSRIP